MRPKPPPPPPQEPPPSSPSPSRKFPQETSEHAQGRITTESELNLTPRLNNDTELGSSSSVNMETHPSTNTMPCTDSLPSAESKSCSFQVIKPVADIRPSSNTKSRSPKKLADPSPSSGKGSRGRSPEKTESSVTVQKIIDYNQVAKQPSFLSTSASSSSVEQLIPPSPPEEVTTPVRLKGQVKLIKRQPREGWL